MISDPILLLAFMFAVVALTRWLEGRYSFVNAFGADILKRVQRFSSFTTLAAYGVRGQAGNLFRMRAHAPVGAADPELALCPRPTRAATASLQTARRGEGQYVEPWSRIRRAGPSPSRG